MGMKERARSSVGICILLVTFLPACGCKKPSDNPALATNEPATATAPTGPRRYSLKGTVISVDPSTKSANIDSEAIPGFMDAMAMDYNVHADADLAKLKPKEKITADLVVTPNGAYIENVNVVGAAADAKAKTP
jgi:Cu/Ag efflux protein CusF